MPFFLKYLEQVTFFQVLSSQDHASNHAWWVCQVTTHALGHSADISVLLVVKLNTHLYADRKINWFSLCYQNIVYLESKSINSQKPHKGNLYMEKPM
jgi:hypothetical protein